MPSFLKFLFRLSFALMLIFWVPDNLHNTLTGNVTHLEGLWRQTDWVEQQMQIMTPEERIGQLFMVAAFSNKDDTHETAIRYLIENYHIGGMIFFQGTPLKQAELTNRYQAASKTPLLIAIDGEWGLGMRLENTLKFPKQLTLGAIQDNNLLYEMGVEIARQCRRVGIQMNMAPVIDVNNNANNPVIYDRSFGEDKYNVARKGIAYMEGMEANGVMACAKHFPGHGDTNSDSHYSLPVINHNIEHLKNIELYPFKELISKKVSGVMVAHLSIPALDNSIVKPPVTQTMPTTLSKKVVTDLLKKEMKYEGLVITDALNMKGVSEFFSPGILDVKALLAGNDILLYPENVGKAFDEIKNAIAKGEITQSEIDSRVRKILKAKYKVGLDKFEPIKTENLSNDLNTANAELLINKLYKSAITLVRNELQLIPFKQLEEKTIASLSIGATTMTDFQKKLNLYAKIEHHTLKASDTEKTFDQKYEDLKGFSHVIIGLHKLNNKASANYGIPPAAIALINKLKKTAQVTVVVFGSPYSLKNFEQLETLVVAYEDNKTTQLLSAQALFGAFSLQGKLPVSASPSFYYGKGENTTGSIRLEYSIPEDVGINARYLEPIDSIARKAIKDGATPGCQILVAKNGKVIYDKSFGYHTYGNDVPVHDSDIYDLASITKIAATALGLMEMYEKGKIELYDTLGKFLPELAGSNKAKLRIRDILIHEAGLEAFIPFYEKTLDPATRAQLYRTMRDTLFSIPVAQGLFLRKDYIDVIYETIKNSSLPHREYKYSDLGFFYFKKMLESYANTSLDQYLNERFYAHLGTNTLCFNPHDRFSKRRIVPSENDTKWRQQRVHGYVHDMGSAMLGGVCGHAGLFSNANDLAILMQMLLNKGHYGGERFFNQSTVELFTAYQNGNSRRGLIFDKPEPNSRYSNPASKLASFKTFGHTGFTGTCAWADPEHQLIYIFLSNRTYPKMSNNKLHSANIRTKIHDVIYQAMAKSKGV
ncbi:MAG: serine hydrolase [Sphingobacteriales bacterium]|nr:MAG: serine hydrolase [Sphingobacteriales bacterium]